MSAVRDCLFNLFAATLLIGGRSSIRNLRTRHAVVTGTHYMVTIFIKDGHLRKEEDEIRSGFLHSSSDLEIVRYRYVHTYFWRRCVVASNSAGLEL